MSSALLATYGKLYKMLAYGKKPKNMFWTIKYSTIVFIVGVLSAAVGLSSGGYYNIFGVILKILILAFCTFSLLGGIMSLFKLVDDMVNKINVRLRQTIVVSLIFIAIGVCLIPAANAALNILS